MRHWKNTAQLFPRLLKYWGILLIIKMLYENADGTGKTWQETPLFAKIIHLADMVDIIGNSRGFSGALLIIWPAGDWKMCRAGLM